MSLCPCRWVPGRWSECSATCGSGFRYRQISCQQVKANGSVETVLADACMHQDRPVGRKPCTGYSCTAGTTQTKEQVGYRVCMEAPHIVESISAIIPLSEHLYSLAAATTLTP